MAFDRIELTAQESGIDWRAFSRYGIPSRYLPSCTSALPRIVVRIGIARISLEYAGAAARRRRPSGRWLR